MSKSQIYVHVNRNVLASNKKHGKNDPAIIVRDGKNRAYCYEVEIAPGVYMVHRENEPLDCGARVYLTYTEDSEFKPVVRK